MGVQAVSYTHLADRLVDICCASCTLPVLCPVTYVDGVPMVDGGVCDAIPIRHAIDDGFRENVIIPVSYTHLR